MGRGFKWFLVVAVLVAGLVVPKWLASRPSSDATVPASAPPMSHLPVEIEVLAPGRLEERLSTSGTVLANEQVEIVSEVPGKVETIFFAEGSLVEQGAVLVRLDAAVALAERDRAQHRFELAQRREARQQQLLSEGLISEESYDGTLSELNVLQAELTLRAAQLEKTQITAPFRGVIGLRSVSPGSYLSSQTRVATLQDVDPVKIEFSVPEHYAHEVGVGDAVEFVVKGAGGRFHGEIYALEPGIDPGTRSLTVRALSPNPEGALVPGAFADVELVVREVEDALSVPSIAVVPELGGKKVFVYADGRAESRIVRTGIRTRTRLEITAGLEPGDQVIVSAVQRLRSGLEVEVAPEPGGDG